MGYLGKRGIGHIFAATSLCAVAIAAEPASAKDPQLPFAIPVQPLSEALLLFSRQSGEMVVVSPSLTDGKRSADVRGTFSTKAAISRLLTGTKLQPMANPSGGFVVVRSTGEATDSRMVVRLASANGAVPLPQEAPAQAESGTGKLEDIVVTARKRTESLQNVPVMVAALSQKTLINNNATDLAKVAELAPQVLFGRYNAGTGALLTIRGISSSPSNAGLDQSVSLSIDGVQLSRGRIISASLFDMQQVEILEGPQALFFGKNSPAGVMSLTTADPTHDFSGYMKAGYEFEAKEKSIEGAVSSGLTDNLSVRIAGRADWMDGWLTNVAGPVSDPITPGLTDPGASQGHTAPAGHDYSGRVTMLWEPTADFSAKLKLTYDEGTVNGGDAYAEPFCVGSTTQPIVLGGLSVPGGDCAKNMVKAVGSEAPQYAVNFPYGNGGVTYERSHFFLGSLTLNKKFDDISVTSVTGYYDQSLSDSFNADYTPYALIYASEHEDYRLVTQELRVNSSFSFPVNFMAGAYYEHSDRPSFYAADLFHAGFNAAAGTYATSEQTTTNSTESFSFFGQLRWNIFPNLELAGGARYSRDLKKSTFLNLANNPAAPSLGILLYPQGALLGARYADNNVSPEATLSWHPKPDQTLYGAFKTGYKAGGIANSALLLANATSGNVQFQHETAKGFEVGYKADLLNHRLRVNLTGYRYRYDGLQVSTFYAPTNSFEIGNAAAARTEGFQAAVNWLATSNLTLNGSFGYNHAYYLSFPNAQCFAGQTVAQGCVGGTQNLAGNALNRAPRTAFNMGADYRLDLPRAGSIDFAVDGAYTSSYQTAEDYAPGGLQTSFWRLNASARYHVPGDHLELAVVGRNLTNSYYMIASYGQSGSLNNDQYVGIFNRPREVLVELSYKF